MRKVAVDFGTTNTVVAVWREATHAPETLTLPGLSMPGGQDTIPLIPSLLYVCDGQTGEVVAGESVRSMGYDAAGDSRLFSSFKRGIAARVRPLGRQLDGALWDDNRAGEAFLKAVMEAAHAAEPGPIDELVLTVPVHSFEQYLKWLRDETTLSNGQGGLKAKRLRIVDESTAAALGYEMRIPGELILVFDFGGGTLDVSLVRMPVAEEGSGVVLESLGAEPGGETALYGDTQVEARVIAKAGRFLGGEDIDHWLLEDVLRRNDVAPGEVGGAYSQLKMAVEMAKIRLSTQESAEISVFDADTYRTYRATVTRSHLEDVLDKHEFYGAIQKTVTKVLRSARARGIFPEDISAVLMIGGTSMLPSVRRLLRAQFGPEVVREHKPFEAVAHGALSLAAGLGLSDFLYHSYGVRHLSPISGRHEWEEIISAGTRYPLEAPVELILTASRDGQEAIELVIGEVEESAGGVAEVMFGERAIIMVDGALELRQVVSMNDRDDARTVAHLDPPGKAGEDRISVSFNVDQNRTLRVNVFDLLTNKTVLHDVPVVELR